MNRSPPRLMTLGCAAVYLFMYAPLLVLMVFSFNQAEYGVAWEGFTLQWYQAVFDNKNIQDALWISLTIAVPTVLISTVIGTFTAFTLYRYKFFGRALFQGALYVPLIMPDLVIGVALLLFDVSVRLELGILSILFAHISFSIPLTTLVIIARMQRIDRNLEDAAMDLGADEWTTMRKVTLPLLKPGILAAALLT